MNKSFSRIRDTRQQSQVRHDLYEIISMTIAAVIGNCDGWDEIEDFCQSKEKWLYVLSLSENQPTLHEYAETCFKDALEHPQWYPEMTSYETVDKEHGKTRKGRITCPRTCPDWRTPQTGRDCRALAWYVLRLL